MERRCGGVDEETVETCGEDDDCCGDDVDIKDVVGMVAEILSSDDEAF